MCPTLAMTVYLSVPRKPAMVFALAPDSTITSGLATFFLRFLGGLRLLPGRWPRVP